MKRYWLLIIITLFLFTRIFKISDTPPSLYWDEASIGYNAYSIIKTGADEWGEKLPVHFKAFSEYKLPVYIYSVALFEIFFGPTEIAVRLPAVLFSLISVMSIFLICLKISKNWTTALLSSFFLTISPWLFIFSRTGYEATAGLAFYLLGLFLFLKSFDRSVFVILSVITFILSYYSYNSFRIIIPLTLIVAIPYYLFTIGKKSKRFPLSIVVAFALIVLSLFPLINLSMTDTGASRLLTVGIFNDADNKPKIIIEFVRNYFSHYNPEFLFQGDNNWRSQQDFGQIYYLDILLVLCGLIFTIQKRKPEYLIPVFLLVLAPIPAAITKESPHALRSILFAPAVAILSAFGVSWLIARYKHVGLVLGAISVYYLISFATYFYSFNKVYSKSSADSWQYGYKIIFKDYADRFNQYDQIIVSDHYNQPYIFALFYSKYDPKVFRSEVVYNLDRRFKTSTVKSFDKYYFENINYYNFPEGKSLIFAHPSEKLTEMQESSVIRNIDGSVSLYVYDYEK